MRAEWRAVTRSCFVSCRYQLQPVGGVALWLAWKCKSPRQVSARTLSDYTNGAVNVSALLVRLALDSALHARYKRHLQSWELLVLKCLDWDVDVVTAYDFVAQLTARMRLEPRAATARLLHDLFPHIHERLLPRSLASFYRKSL